MFPSYIYNNGGNVFSKWLIKYVLKNKCTQIKLLGLIT